MMRKRLLQLTLLVWIMSGAQKMSAQTPILSSLSPPSALQGQSAQILIRGKNFVAGQTVVSINPSSGVLVGTTTVTNSALLTVPFTINGNAAPGERVVTVTTPGGLS